MSNASDDHERVKKSLTRRLFLGGAAGTGAAVTLAGCGKRMPRFLVPDVVPADDAVPGIARHRTGSTSW